MLELHTERTDDGDSYTVQSHSSFLAHVAVIDGQHFILHERVRDREPTPVEIRELAAALIAVADVLS